MNNNNERAAEGAAPGASSTGKAPGSEGEKSLTRGLSSPQAGWLHAILTVAGHYQLDASAEHIRTFASWSDQRKLRIHVQQMAQHAGLAVRWLAPSLKGLTSWRLPLVAQLDDGQVLVIASMTEAGLRVFVSGDQGLESEYTLEQLEPHISALAAIRPNELAPDSRVDDYISPVKEHWMRSIVFADKRPYAHIFIASLVANLMALAGIIFSMQVYDRVVPAQSYPTLYVLFAGVMIATVLAWVMRAARMRISDVLGKRADLRISDRVFGHALRVRNTARPRATGTFISQLRELESVREMMTSSTVSVVADIPFFVLFCVIFWFIAGSLVWVPLVAFVLLVVPSLLAQKRLRSLAQLGMREASLRNAMLVEAVQCIEDIKLLQAEPRFQNQWNHYNTVHAESGLQMRKLLNGLNNWMQAVQGTAFAFVVFFGVPQVIDGEISTGVLVAASILVTRMLAPLAGVTQVLNRWQQAKVATEALNTLMALPVDQAPNSTRIHRANLRGEYALAQAIFGYDKDTRALEVRKLSIRPGERIAILGRNGAGKSTLLQALSGLLEPKSGQVMLDGASLEHIDPADVRRDVGFLSQNARLMHGTLGENLRLGAPHATDEEIEIALRAAGAWDFVQRIPKGLDLMVQEGGLGLSGGQRQSLLLARALLRQPNVLLLDEPTASLDETAEREVLQKLCGLPRHMTLIMATHRPAVLLAVRRVIVVDQGRIVLDGARDKVITALRNQAAATTAAAAAPESAPEPTAAAAGEAQ